MKNKQTTIFSALLFCLLCTYQSLYGQVKGISYTISPAVGYSFWDDNSGLEDSFLWGGKLGFGFGQNLELRAIYMRAIDQKTNFSNIDIPNFSNELYTPRSVDYSRIGGEVKINISRKKLLPFITLGTGIQSIRLEDFGTNELIYASLGAGITFSIADRFTVNLEGKNTPYNFNTGSLLLSPEDKAQFNLSEDDFQSYQLRQNWVVNASVQVYLGGRRPGSRSDLDQAYDATFANGLKGLRVPFEPTLGHINWNDELPYRNAWLGGVYLGLDFGPYIGIRGFYLQAMEDDQVSLNFDPLAMYGGELRAKLRASRGFTPYLMLGGGYINAGDNYTTSDPELEAENQAFASGGIGLDLPISKRILIFGGLRSILTTGTNVEDLESTDEIKNSWSYSFGVSLVFGKKSSKNKQTQTVQPYNSLELRKQENERNRQILELEYEQRLVRIDKKLDKAINKQDTAKVSNLVMEKKKNEEVLEELKVRAERKEAAMIADLQQDPEALKQYYEEKTVQLESDLNKAYADENLTEANTIKVKLRDYEDRLAAVKMDSTKSIDTLSKDSSAVTAKPATPDKAPATEGRVTLSLLEFEHLIEEILESTEPKTGYPSMVPPAYSSDMYQRRQQDLEARILAIEKSLQQIQAKFSSDVTTPPAEETELLKKSDLDELSDELNETIQGLRDQLEKNREAMQKQLDAQQKPPENAPQQPDQEGQNR